VAATVGLFLVWSNSFIAIGYLLGRDGSPRRFDWTGLTVARFLPAAAICAAYCFAFRRRESLDVLRRYPVRLVVCGLLAVPGYNLALYFGQQHGVPAPVASLVTTLVPLFVMILAAMFLHERLTARRVLGFLVAGAGMVTISLARGTGGDRIYPLLVAITALAPLSWSLFSIISKPLAGRVSPIVWTYLATSVGSLAVLPFLAGTAWGQWSNLDPRGWVALLYLSIPCTVLGFAIWTWLLRFLPASTVGFTVFLNPPLTTVSKYLLAVLLPATFAFSIGPREWIGGVLTLSGLAIAVSARRRPAEATRAPGGTVA
jgi:drug/metabolite transporter (DMT)-like permease